MARLNWNKMEVDRRTHLYGTARIEAVVGAGKREHTRYRVKQRTRLTQAELIKQQTVEGQRRQEKLLRQEEQAKRALANKEARGRRKAERRAAAEAQRLEQRRKLLEERQDPVKRAKRIAKMAAREARRPKFEVVRVKHRHPIPWPAGAPLHCPRCSGPTEIRLANRKGRIVVGCMQRHCGWTNMFGGKQRRSAGKARKGSQVELRMGSAQVERQDQTARRKKS